MLQSKLFDIDDVTIPTMSIPSGVPMLEKGFNCDDEFEDKLDAVKRAFYKIWDNGKHCLLLSSYGKDSSTLLTLFLNAAVEYRQDRGQDIPESAVVTSDTGLENPVFHQYLVGELEKVREFVETNILPVRVEVARPNLSGNYLVSVLGGRTVFDFYDSGASKCATNLKVTPINKLKKKIFKDFDKEQTVSLLGLRFTESEHRKRNMIERGDRPDRDIKDKNGEWVQSPIAHFTDDDILMFLGYVRSGLIKGYSDFNRLIDLYRESAGGECLVNRMADQNSKKSACQSSRQGCWICLKVNDDKSMSNMLKLDEYSFMQPLADFRDFVKKTHYDLSRRCFLSRRLNEDGKSIKLRPNSYSPDHCEELLKYALTIDADERECAAAENRSVRFQLLSLSDVIGCDILLNRYGYHRGLHACYLWRKICIFGERYYPPVMPAAPKVPIPPAISVPFVAM